MFDNLITLFGMPRSGTTIISRLISNHTKLNRIIEPYQTKRKSGYSETNLSNLCVDHEIVEKDNKSILVKETFTRTANLELLSKLMDSSSRNGYRVGYIFVLRSPLESFLSQVDAAAAFWAEEKKPTLKPRSFQNFWDSFEKAIDHYMSFAFRFHRRFVVFDRFVRQPREEIGRCMGLFGYSLEDRQLDLSSADLNFGGDPKATGAQALLVQDRDHFRSKAVQRLLHDFSGNEAVERMRAVHEYTKRISLSQPQSDDIIRDLTLLLRRGYV